MGYYRYMPNDNLVWLHMEWTKTERAMENASENEKQALQQRIEEIAEKIRREEEKTPRR